MTSKGLSIFFTSLRSSKSSISHLHISGIGLNELESLMAFGKYINENTSISSVHFNSSQVNDDSIKHLTPYVVGNKNLEQLYFLGASKVTESSLSSLIKMIEYSSLNALTINTLERKLQHRLAVPLLCNKLKKGSEESIGLQGM